MSVPVLRVRAVSVLVLGGTAEARALAAVLVEEGTSVVSSLAGRVARPRLPVGEVRIGGFGGAGGLADHLRETRSTVVVDATHPFAERISRHAAAACAQVEVPLLRLARPGWGQEQGADGWHWVEDHHAAAAAAAATGQRPFLTVGRQPLPAFVAPLADRDALVRVVDEPAAPLPATWRVVRERGPYRLEDEVATLREHGADVLVTKDSGGAFTRPKLEAAARLGVPVVVVRRPPAPVGVPSVATVAEAADWVRGQR